MAGQLHDDRPVDARFPSIGRPCVAEIIETEIPYSCLLQGLGQLGLDAFQELFVIREGMTPEVDSLNVAMDAGLVIYETLRQGKFS